MKQSSKSIIPNILKHPLRIIRNRINRNIPLESKSFENIDIGRCPFPSEAFFLMNNRCNARCTMCMVADYLNDKLTKEITLDKFKIIAQNLHLEKLKAVILSGGEPLLSRDVLDIISFINQCYPHVMVNITTNAIALAPEKAKQLVKMDVNLLSISVNAGTKETYKRVMQVDCFERVIENIKHYQALCLKAKKQPSIWLSFVAHRKNIEDLINFVELGNSLGLKLLTTTYCRFYPTSQRLKLAVNEENFLDDTDSLFFHQELSDRYFREAEGLSHRLGIEFRREPLFSEDFPRGKCKFPFSSILVGIDGEVFPCCGGEVIFKEKVSRGDYHFGNLLEERLEDFWNNGCYRAVRYSVLNPENPPVPECSVCVQALMWNGHIQKSHILEWDGLSDKSIDFGLIQSEKLRS
jgi:MoaA/NifB/PqqE/SkfB family radical SAM enzyme